MDFPTFSQALHSVFSRGLKDDQFTKTLFQNIYEKPDCVTESPIEKCALGTYRSYFWGTTKIDNFAKNIRNDLNKKKFTLFLNTPDSCTNRKLFVYAFKSYVVDIDENNCIRTLATIFFNIIQEAAGLPVVSEVEEQTSVDTLSNQLPFDFDAPPTQFDNKLLLEANYHCQFIGCRKSLYVLKNNLAKDNFKSVVIDEDLPCTDFNNLIAMCPDCAELYKLDHTPNEKEKMKKRKKQLMDSFATDKYLSQFKVEEGIESLLRKVKNIDYDKLDKQTSDPVSIKEKIEKSRVPLYVKINGYALNYFNDIDAVQKRLSKAGDFNFNTFKCQIHAMFEYQKSKGLNQNEVFDLLSNWLKDCTNESLDICEAVISYFIQICEVFDAIS